MRDVTCQDSKIQERKERREKERYGIDEQMGGKETERT
jgi:hypothetical protein